MKHISTQLIAIWLASVLPLLNGCGVSRESGDEARTLEKVGPAFKQGHGLEVPEETRKVLGVELVDVNEQKITPTFQTLVQVYREASEIIPASTDSQANLAHASGLISAEQAKQIHVGQRVVLQPSSPGAEPLTGTLLRPDRFAEPAVNHVEALIAFPDPHHRFRIGTFLNATWTGDSAKEVAAVPRSALLETVAGTFVYVVNGSYFLRTAVQTGAENADFVEITDGLYVGDKVVKQPVMSLWMTELQATKAGQSCCAVPKK